MALAGTFEDVSFAELLQMLNVGHKTGRLTVRRGEEEAVLFLCRGEVARAVSRREKGPDLVYRILGWKIGEFRFEQSDEPVIRDIKQSTEALILEGMKRFDEWQRFEAEMPNMEVVLRQRAFAVNERFNDLSPEAQALLPLVDARRNVATIIRESGMEPMQALAAVSELLVQEVVEEWASCPERGDVIVTGGRLPAATGAIDLQPSPCLASKRQPLGRPRRLSDRQQAAMVQERRDEEDCH